MRLFSTAHFGWDEPKQFLRLHDAFRKSKQPKWMRIVIPIWLGGIAVTSVDMAWGKGFDPSNLASLIFSLGALAYVSPWVVSLFPSEIHFYDDHIARVRGGERKKIKYGNIESVAWREGDEFATLILRKKKAQEEIFIGVPLRYPRERVEEFLGERARRRQ